MTPTLACIGGTAAYDLLQKGAFVARRLGPRETPFGPSQPVYLCESRFGEFLFLSRHGESGYELAPSFVNYRANLFALKDLGVELIVSWSETRAICHNYKVGEYVLVHDVIDETHQRPTTMFENLGLGNVRQWPVFCPTLRSALASTLLEGGYRFGDSGVYVCIEGPRRETPAEARKYATYGADLLGYTLAPEVFLARELQLCYASLAYVASHAENGSDFRPFEHGRILEQHVLDERATAAVERFPMILERLCQVLQHTTPQCRCGAEIAAQLNGRANCDWRSWFDHIAAQNGVAHRANGHRAADAKVVAAPDGAIPVRESARK